METGKNHKMIIIGCGLASVILLIILLFAIRTSWQKADRLQESGIHAVAEIVSFNLDTTVESEKAIITFTDQSGGVYTMPLGFYSSDMYIGMKVPILYAPENVNMIMYTGDNSFFINYGANILMLISAFVLGYIAVTTYIKYRKTDAE